MIKTPRIVRISRWFQRGFVSTLRKVRRVACCAVVQGNRPLGSSNSVEMVD